MVRIGGGDGSSFENAIIISDCNNIEGVNQEYIEIKKRFGNYKLIRQSLLNHNGLMFGKLELKLDNGNNIKVFFDITDFFGKDFQF
ncbi:MAG: hypothetical protein ACFFHV_24055 [Promethearchaeota archaeon]